MFKLTTVDNTVAAVKKRLVYAIAWCLQADFFQKTELGGGGVERQRRAAKKLWEPRLAQSALAN